MGVAVILTVSAIVVCGAAVLAVRRRFVAVTVIGASMEPTYRSGDRVLVRRTRLPAIRTGQVVVVERLDRPVGPGGRHRAGARPWRPIAGRSWTIKRTAAVPGEAVPSGLEPALAQLAGEPVPPDRLVVLGDNRPASVDSRHYGFVSGMHVLGVVVRRMDPAGREDLDRAGYYVI